MEKEAVLPSVGARLTPTVHAWLVQAAEKEGRSIASQIRRIIEAE